jgi:stage III sporulation protein AG
MVMNYLRELFKNKDKKTLVNIGTALAIGVFLLIISSSFFTSENKRDNKNSPASGEPPSILPMADTNQTNADYIEQLQKNMEETLSQIENVGDVKVMLTISYGREIIIALDKTANESNTTEKDAGGGERVAGTSNVDEKTVIITDSNGVDHPLILKEVQPRIEGVLIIAEGGDNVFVKEELTHAAEALLGLSANKVQVSKMKK